MESKKESSSKNKKEETKIETKNEIVEEKTTSKVTEEQTSKPSENPVSEQVEETNTSVEPEIVIASNTSTTVETNKAEVKGEYNPSASNALLQSDTPLEPLAFVELPEGVTFEGLVENNRVSFVKTYKKLGLPTKILYIILLVLAVGAVVTFSLLVNNEKLKWLIWLMFGIILVGVIITAIISSKTRKKKDVKAFEYIHVCLANNLSEVYKNTGIEEARFSAAATVKDEDVTTSHYFTVINKISSRFRLECKYLGRDYSETEVDVYVPTLEVTNSMVPIGNYKDTEVKPGPNLNEIKDEYNADNVEPKTENAPANAVKEIVTASDSEVKKEEKQEEKAVEQPTKEDKPQKAARFSATSGIYGKFISYDLCLQNNEGIIFVFKGKETFLPNYLTNYELVQVEGLYENVICYSTSEEFAKQLCSEQLLEVLNSFQADNIYFYGGFISMNSYGTRIALNFADSVCQLPLDSHYEVQNIESYKENVHKVLKFLKVVQE